MQVLLGSLMQLQVTKTPAGYANMAAKNKKTYNSCFTVWGISICMIFIMSKTVESVRYTWSICIKSDETPVPYVPSPFYTL